MQRLAFTRLLSKTACVFNLGGGYKICFLFVKLQFEVNKTKHQTKRKMRSFASRKHQYCWTIVELSGYTKVWFNRLKIDHPFGQEQLRIISPFAVYLSIVFGLQRPPESVLRTSKSKSKSNERASLAKFGIGGALFQACLRSPKSINIHRRCRGGGRGGGQAIAGK